MAGKKRDKPKAQDLHGFKYFKVLSGLLETLHEAACQRDRAHNRILHMDQYMTLLLMYMFNPICSSLRALQEASELKKVQRVLKVARRVPWFAQRSGATTLLLRRESLSFGCLCSGRMEPQS